MIGRAAETESIITEVEPRGLLHGSLASVKSQSLAAVCRDAAEKVTTCAAPDEYARRGRVLPSLLYLSWHLGDTRPEDKSAMIIKSRKHGRAREA